MNYPLLPLYRIVSHVSLSAYNVNFDILVIERCCFTVQVLTFFNNNLWPLQW